MILKKALKYMSIIFPVILTGCSDDPDLTLRFADDMIIDYASDTHPLSLITGIGDQDVTEVMIDNDTLTYGNFVVTCDQIDTSVLGDTLLRYTTNNPDQRYVTKKVRIADLSPPIISLQSDKLVIDADDYAAYDFNDFVDVTDNWTEDDPMINITIQSKINEEHYILQVNAKDVWDNQSSKSFDLYLKHPPQDEKAEIDELPENPDVQQPPLVEQPVNNNDDSSMYTPAEEPSIPEQSIENQTPESFESKDFLFAEGYTISNVSEVCHAALIASGKSGSCTPIKGTDGLLLGMRLELYP